MATLQGAIQEIAAQVGAVDGINHAPDEPAEQITAWPAVMTYATDGSSINEPSNVIKDLHTITLAIVMPLNDIRQATRTMLPLYETIVDKIVTHRNGRTSSHYQTFGAITYTLGPIEWPSGQLMYGFLLTLNGVKIQNET